MKTFKEHLSESKKQYTFRVKVAGDFTTEQETTLKSLLDRYVVSSFKKTGKTPIQALPLDFPQVKNCEVSIYEVTLDYPTTQQELTEYISSNLGVSKRNLAIRRPGEPSEEYQTPVVEREGALLNDGEYKESPNAKFEEFYGDKYNSGFVKELNDILKLQRKERGEQIPMETAAKFNTDSPANTTSPIKQSDYAPRK
jgi:hypothetical protein